MDLRALREEAIEATSRALWDKHGFVPSEDSDEWEAEYRRQFTRLKQQGGSATPSPAPAARAPAGAAAPEPRWPELSGTLEQRRWAATIRAERLAAIPNEPMRAWLASAWTRAKLWIDTQDVPIATLLQRLQPQYADYRRKTAERQKARTDETQAKAAAAAAREERLRAAGITPANLVELIDASERTDPAPIKAKIAEIAVDGRHLRIFETSDPARLLVKEKNGAEQLDYGIDRDAGLVADLATFAKE
ncbi:MAG: hypothetical protein JO267_05910 [Alphaproteobacteria bacterium]|nr:hypothetical protein [Alphaproteobacteria bacterium]